MYEKSAVLDYNGRKIWVRNIHEGLYFMNGAFIKVDDTIQLDAECCAAVLDIYYSPFNGNCKSDDILFWYLNKNTNNRMIGVLHMGNEALSIQEFAKKVEQEYMVWRDSKEVSSIYINDERNVDRDVYMQKHFNKNGG